MSIVDRVRNICVSPATEWPVIAQERTDPATLVGGYLAPLAAISAIAGFIGSTLLRAILPFGGVFGGFVGGLVTACVTFVMTIVGCFVIAFVINALAPTFGGRQDYTQAFKVAVYSYTPGLVAGILRIFPFFGALIVLLASLYGLYLLYVGLQVLMNAPRDKAVAYTVVVIIATIVLWFVTTAILGVLGFAGMMLRG